MGKIRLRQICHARSGDKAADVNIGLAPYDPRHYEWMRDHVTDQAVADYLADYLKEHAAGPVVRYELPKVRALNFVVRNGLAGGVSRATILDGHGKAFSSILLDMEIEAPPDLT